jgi:GTP-binding protein
MSFKIPMRGLIGYASEFKNDTHGTGLMNQVFVDYELFKGEIEVSRKGALISMASGVVTSYALSDLESRGTIFVEPGTKVYAGMVIGECSRSLDIEVNPCRAKVLTNMRSTVKEEFVRLTPPRLMSLEEIIAYVAGT